jgi:hypothetical protein
MSCPDGGQFFICTNIVPGGFVGCCNTPDACTAQGCGSGGLYVCFELVVRAES